MHRKPVPEYWGVNSDKTAYDIAKDIPLVFGGYCDDEIIPRWNNFFHIMISSHNDYWESFQRVRNENKSSSLYFTNLQYKTHCVARKRKTRNVAANAHLVTYMSQRA